MKELNNTIAVHCLPLHLPHPVADIAYSDLELFMAYDVTLYPTNK